MRLNKNKNKILSTWLQRNISIFGRRVTKMERISRLIYLAYSLATPDRCINKINQIHYNFIWNIKQHLIRKGDMAKSVGEGGLNVIDFEVMNVSIKLIWLQNLLKFEHCIWFSVPSYLFQMEEFIFS